MTAKKGRYGILLLTLGVLIALAAQEGGYKPYLEKVTEGEVDWYEGWIRVTATAPIDATSPKAKAQLDARRVALTKARAAALRIAMRVPVDSESRLESFQVLQVKVKGVVNGAEVVAEETRAREVSLTLEVPVSGVKGLSSEVLPVLFPPGEPAPAPKPKPAQEPKPDKKAATPDDAPSPESPAYVSVTVETSEVGAKPALFPRIVDPQGRDVYSVKTIGRLGATDKSIARYVTASSGNAPKVGLRDIQGANLPLALIAAGGPFWLLQGPPPSRKRGGETLLVKASGTKGALKADIVVTEETAKKLRDAEGSSKVLSDARVVVVVRSDVGGVEGRRRAVNQAVELARR
jgi:hypothetical protein